MGEWVKVSYRHWIYFNPSLFERHYMTCIAVMVNTYGDIQQGALEWARKVFMPDGGEYNRTDRMLKDASRCVMFITPEDMHKVLGYNFAGYIKYPNFHTLEDVVRRMTRP